MSDDKLADVELTPEQEARAMALVRDRDTGIYHVAREVIHLRDEVARLTEAREGWNAQCDTQLARAMVAERRVRELEDFLQRMKDEHIRNGSLSGRMQREGDELLRKRLATGSAMCSDHDIVGYCWGCKTTKEQRATGSVDWRGC